MNGLQPQVQWQVASFKDRADLHGERLPALVAFIGTDTSTLAVHLGNAGCTATVRTNRTPRPDAGFGPAVRGGLIVKPFGI